MVDVDLRLSVKLWKHFFSLVFLDSSTTIKRHFRLSSFKMRLIASWGLGISKQYIDRQHQRQIFIFWPNWKIIKNCWSWFFLLWLIPGGFSKKNFLSFCFHSLNFTNRQSVIFSICRARLKSSFATKRLPAKIIFFVICYA